MKINQFESMIFLFNTHISIQRNLTAILSFQRNSLPSKYLGVPLTVQAWKKSNWKKKYLKPWQHGQTMDHKNLELGWSVGPDKGGATSYSRLHVIYPSYF